MRDREAPVISCNRIGRSLDPVQQILMLELHGLVWQAHVNHSTRNAYCYCVRVAFISTGVLVKDQNQENWQQEIAGTAAEHIERLTPSHCAAEVPGNLLRMEAIR